MLKKIIEWFDREQQLKNYQAALDQALSELQVLRAKQPSSKDVVNIILDRPIEWVDWRSLDEEKRIAWGRHAKEALNNPALIALIGKVGASPTSGELVKSLAEAIARRAQNFDEVRDMRMSMNGIELIREILEEMLFDETPASQEDLNAPI